MEMDEIRRRRIHPIFKLTQFQIDDTMPRQDEINARLAEFEPIYEEIGGLRQALVKLQQAELAHAEYIKQTSQLDEEIRQLTAKQKEIDAPQQKAQMEEAGVQPFRPSSKTYSAAHNRLHRREMTPLNPLRQQPIQRARIELKKLVMRWGYFWKLTGDTRGHINRIADDPSRPLGEALALLKWETFKNPAGSETDETHLARITSWGSALMEYRDRLLDDIDMLKTRYRLVMPILDAWIDRDTVSGRESWDKQIAETNAAKEKEVERLRHEIARLSGNLI